MTFAFSMANCRVGGATWLFDPAALQSSLAAPSRNRPRSAYVVCVPSPQSAARSTPTTKCRPTVKIE